MNDGLPGIPISTPRTRRSVSWCETTKNELLFSEIVFSKVSSDDLLNMPPIKSSSNWVENDPIKTSCLDTESICLEKVSSHKKFLNFLPMMHIRTQSDKMSASQRSPKSSSDPSPEPRKKYSKFFSSSDPRKTSRNSPKESDQDEIDTKKSSSESKNKPRKSISSDESHYASPKKNTNDIIITHSSSESKNKPRKSISSDESHYASPQKNTNDTIVSQSSSDLKIHSQKSTLIDEITNHYPKLSLNQNSQGEYSFFVNEVRITVVYDSLCNGKHKLFKIKHLFNNYYECSVINSELVHSSDIVMNGYVGIYIIIDVDGNYKLNDQNPPYNNVHFLAYSKKWDTVKMTNYPIYINCCESRLNISEFIQAYTKFFFLLEKK